MIGIDAQNSRVLTDHGSISYDYLVLAPGSVTNDFGNVTVRNLAYSLKTLPDALGIRNAVMEALERARWAEDSEQRRILSTFVVVGGGPVGVEYAGAVIELLRAVLRKDFREADLEAKVVLLEAGPRILPLFDERLADKARRDDYAAALEQAILEMQAFYQKELGISRSRGRNAVGVTFNTFSPTVRSLPLGRERPG